MNYFGSDYFGCNYFQEYPVLGEVLPNVFVQEFIINNCDKLAVILAAIQAQMSKIQAITPSEPMSGVYTQSFKSGGNQRLQEKLDYVTQQINKLS